MDGFEAVQEIAKAGGGTIKEVMDFGNGHGGATQGCEPTGSAPTPQVVVIRAWHIGEEGEVFAGQCSDEEMKEWYRKLVATSTEPDYGDKCIADCFEELSQAEMDAERDWTDGEFTKKTTYRKEAEDCTELPCQIATLYT